MKINLKKIKYEVCNTLFKNFRGLMFSKKKNIMLVAKKESRFASGIHSFFVFFTFDAYFLDKNKKIVDYKRIKPFTIYIPKKPAKYVLEISKP
ncbi:MAG: DUF192 domain-containing protein [Candidatus Nanoarchaeia archaeon]